MASNNVQRFRENLMMSKAELARKAGLSTLTIDRVEAGRPCRLDTKRKILLALGFKVSDKDRVFGALVGDEPAVTEIARHLDVSFTTADSGEILVAYKGRDVSRAIRTEEGGRGASTVAAIPSVREALLARQREFRQPPGLVADGR